MTHAGSSFLHRYASTHSLWYYVVSGGCCANEVWNAYGCRYDLERFGCQQEYEPEKADLLIVVGAVSLKMAPHLLELYERMLAPKYVMSVGSCAHGGGAFCQTKKPVVLEGIDRLMPVDIYVPGCPPRPEAILNGMIALQEKIQKPQKREIHG